MMLASVLVFILTCLPIISSQITCSWTESRDVNTAGSIAQASASTLAACQALCIAQANSCANGFDYIYVAGATSIKCFLSTTSTTSSASGYSHYTCFSSAAVTTKVTENSQIVTTPASGSGGPQYVWIETANSNSPGGNLKTSFGTFDQCKNGCIAVKDTECMYGIDFNPSLPAGSGCYFASSNKINVGGYPGVTHYEYKFSSDTPKCTYDITADKNSPGGNLITSAGDLESCKTACLAANNCAFGFDFNPSVPKGSQCYVSTTSQLSIYPGVSHYTPNCPTPCSWNMTADRNSPQGKVMGSYNTLVDCQQACLTAADTSSCQHGIDFQPSAPVGFRCYFSVSSTLTTFIGVNHYTPSCQRTSSTCTFVELADKNSPSGMMMSTLNSLSDCKTRCEIEVKSSCQYGFDYVPNAPIGARCWFSTTTTTNSAPGITHYNPQCSSPGVTSTPDGCTWTKTAGQNSPNGAAQASITSLDACQASCITKQTSGCANGIDWNQSAQPGFQCWFAVSSTLTAYPAVDHYSLSCGAVTCTWAPMENMNARGGLNQNFNTLETCRAACLTGKDTTCKLGFDWEQNGQTNFKCWFSTTSTLTSFNGVVHYSQSCGGATTGSAFGTTLMNAGGTGGMEYTFTLVDNSFSPNGIAQASANTFDQCRMQCILMVLTSCKYGFDWNAGQPDGSKCWFSVMAATFPGMGIAHYVPVLTPKCAWSISTNSNTAGGILQTDATTLALCQSKCLTSINTTCTLGFDYNNINKQCYFSTSPTVNSGVQNVDHYACSLFGATTNPQQTTVQFTTTLPRNVGCNWVTQVDTNSPGGEAQTLETLSACQFSCITAKPSVGAGPACPLGIDWIPNAGPGQKCWFSTLSSTAPSPGITHYKCV